MKRIIKYMARPTIGAALSLMLIISVSAADIPAGQDIDSLWQDGSKSVVDVINEQSGDFDPSETLTVRQWAVMLWQSYGQRAVDDPALPCSQAELALTYREGWLDMNIVSKPDADMCRAAVYQSIFAAENVQIYPYEFYEEGIALSAPENYIRVGYENGLCGENVDPYELITVGEAIQILCQTQKSGLRSEPPQIIELWNIHDADENGLEMYLREFQRVPHGVLEEYIQRGWTFQVNSQTVDQFSEELGITCAGMTDYQKKTIYAKSPACVLHEFGHFFHQTLGYPDHVIELYKVEAQSASTVLGDYAQTNPREFFAEFFSYWCSRGGDKSRMHLLEEQAPETFAYFLSLEDAMQ